MASRGLEVIEADSGTQRLKGNTSHDLRIARLDIEIDRIYPCLELLFKSRLLRPASQFFAALPGMSLWTKKLTPIFSVGRKLEDGGMYVIDLEDLYPAGILVLAYNQATSERYTLSVSEGEIAKTGLSRSEEDLRRLAESINVYQVKEKNFIHSIIDGIAKPKVIPTGDDARYFVQGIRAGNGSLEEFLTAALSELCKVKPEGLNAARWLGNWLLSHNPNQPTIMHADDDQLVEEPEE